MNDSLDVLILQVASGLCQNTNVSSLDIYPQLKFQTRSTWRAKSVSPPPSPPLRARDQVCGGVAGRGPVTTVEWLGWEGRKHQSERAAQQASDCHVAIVWKSESILVEDGRRKQHRC